MEHEVAQAQDALKQAMLGMDFGTYGGRPCGEGCQLEGKPNSSKGGQQDGAEGGRH